MILRLSWHQFRKRIFVRSSSTSATIFALATGSHIRSGIAVLRVSGSAATQSLLSLTKEKDLNRYKPTQLYLRKLFHHQTNDLIDQCLVTWFKGKSNIEFIVKKKFFFIGLGPKSFTGEDVVEL